MNKCFGLLLTASVLIGGNAFGEVKQIRFGIEPGYPPFDVKMPDGSLSGFDVDIGNALCAELKAKCVWVENPFDGMIPALKAKKFDGILSGMSITEKRMQEIDFTNRLYRSPSRLVARADAKLKPTLEALKGKRVGVQQGTTEENYANTYWAGKGVEVVSYQSQDQVYSDLVAGRLDAALQEAVQASESFLGKPHAKGFAFAGDSLRDDKIFGVGAGIGLRKDDAALKKSLNEALARLKANGTYTRIMKKYFEYDISGD